MSIDEIIDLLNCPFCGGDAHFGTVRFGKNAVPKEERGRVNHFVSCDLCNSTTQTITGYGTREEAADHWNTRTESPELTQTREALAAAEEWKLELIKVFKRNISMHENSPFMYGGTDKQKAEVVNFTKGLKRGLEILQFDDHAVKAQAEIKRLMKGE